MKRYPKSLVIRKMQIKTKLKTHTCYNGHHQKKDAGVDVEKRESSCTVSGNVNWYSHYEK